MKYKSIALFLCLCLLVTLYGCKKKEPPPTEPEPDTANMTVLDPAATAVPSTTNSGTLTLTDSVAYALEGMLYGGITYTNTNASPLSLTEAVFTFTYAGGTKTETLLAFAPESDIVMPGETACAALYVPLGAEENIAGDISLTVALTGTAATASPQRLSVSDAMLTHNYPRFATLTGSLNNPTADICNLNMIYAHFYDDTGRLLGVWYFSRNAIIQPGDSVPFSVHLSSLPIPGLADNTASIRFYAYGIS